MKSLRRSLNDKSSSSHHPPSSAGSSAPHPSPPLPGVGSLARPSAKVAPPQKVIKALNSHRSTNPQELSYTKGDFWYVTGERDGWYEALNPLTGSRGLVPKTDFEEFVKGGRTISGAGQSRAPAESSSRSHTPNGAHLSQTSSNPMSPPGAPRISPPIQAGGSGGGPGAGGIKKGPPRQPVYAIVQFDFVAERPDELNASKGEPIVVIAQSNHEWFVAKPIGRLGGPGLIPVTFVEIRDPATGKPIEVLPETIPMVEEWKKATADYKAASIPLGRFDLGPEAAVANSPYAPGAGSHSQGSLPRSSSTNSVGAASGGAASSAKQNGNAHTSLSPPSTSAPQGQHYKAEQDLLLPPGDLTSLSVPSFHNESGNYWFRLHVVFLPDDHTSPAFTLSLYRTYEDFYDFQISLLDTFPFEAGRPRPGEEDGSPPERILPYMPGPVDDEIDDELTEYRREELDAYVRALIELKDKGAGYILRHELFRTFFAAKYGDYCEECSRAEAGGSVDADAGLEERLAELSTGDEASRPVSSGAAAGYRSQSAASRHSQTSRQPQSGDRLSSLQQWAPQHAQSRSQSSRGNSPMPLAPVETSAASPSTRPDSAGYRPYSGGGARVSAQGSQPYTAGTTSSSSWGGGQAPQPPSASSATGSSAPGVGGQQPPYIKIKIYDRATDDLIAIRVHPSVSHAELFEKVRARLGNEVGVLRYRTGGMGGAAGYQEIRDDRELREWLSIDDQKLVLYAEQA